MSRDLIQKSETSFEITNLNEIKKIRVICPICKTNTPISVPKSIINQTTQLTTISIPKGLVCAHHFQAFVDKQFNVRGYQKVDFELKNGKIEGQKFDEKKNHDFSGDDDNFFKNLILEGNFVEYNPNKIKENHIKEVSLEKPLKENEKTVDDEIRLSEVKKEKTLEEIYEEFWEFIDDDNYEFKVFIINDQKRRKG